MRSVDSLLLLGLAGLASQANAHPAKRQPNSSPLSKRGVDLDAFRLPELAKYVPQDEVPDISNARVAPASDYTKTAEEFVKSVVGKATFRLVSDHYVGTNGVAHVRFKQTVNDIDVDNADFNVNIGADGKVFSYGNSFYTGKLPGPLVKRDTSDPVTALKSTVEVLDLPVDASDAKAEAKGDEHYTFTDTSGTVQKPEAKLVYLIDAEQNLKLTWRVETDVLDNWLLTYVDADKTEKIVGVVDYVADLATYEVYPWGVNDPSKGSRTVVEDPWNIQTSEFTWISDGSANYTTTRGNNAIAQVNPSGGTAYLNNYRPSSSSLEFEYTFSTSQTDPVSYRDASITQLFYTANKYHDLLHLLGFDEAAGNFEVNNNGQGGRGNDFVILNSQDGSGTNNANFATPADGSPGRMRMYLWTYSTPRRDSSFDAGVVIHEYTHGLSNRLTGGPANSACLSGTESGGMGEGWSDFMATAVHLGARDTRSTNHVMGDWVYNNANGIRAYPYSTSLTTNPYTYRSVNSLSGVHAVGTFWATALYEVLWNLIDKHGKNDADTPTFDSNGVPTDGKYLTMKLVVDGLALQPCNPNMVQARDAILDADVALTGGDNQCELWTGFAKRGLGTGARYSSTSRTESFALPSGPGLGAGYWDLNYEQILVVFGATGNQGSSVIRHVLHDPELSKTYTIRAVTRDPSSSRARDLASQGIEVVSGDPSDKPSLDGVFRGAHTVFAMTTSNYDGEAHKEIQYGKDLVDAAIAQGVQYYIWSTLPSPNAISGGKYTKVTGFDDKFVVEEYIRSKPSLKSAFYSPGSFMQNYATIMQPQPSPDNDGSYVIARPLRPSTKLPLVDIAGDTGKFVVAILAQPDKFQGKKFSGATRLYSMEEQASIISAATGRDVKYVEVSQDVYRSFLPPTAQDELLQMMLYQQEFGYYGPQTEAEVVWSVENARGNPTSFEEFLSKHPLMLK